MFQQCFRFALVLLTIFVMKTGRISILSISNLPKTLFSDIFVDFSLFCLLCIGLSTQINLTDSENYGHRSRCLCPNNMWESNAGTKLNTVNSDFVSLIPSDKETKMLYCLCVSFSPGAWNQNNAQQNKQPHKRYEIIGLTNCFCFIAIIADGWLRTHFVV